MVGFVNNPSEWCHSTTHLQNTSNIPKHPQKKTKKRQNIHNNIHSSSTTNYSHTWNKSLGQNLDEILDAVSLVVDDGSVYLFVSETDHTHMCGRGIWCTLMSSPVCCHSVAPSVNGCCSNPMYKQYIHSMYTKYMLLC